MGISVIAVAAAKILCRWPAPASRQRNPIGLGGQRPPLLVSSEGSR